MKYTESPLGLKPYYNGALSSTAILVKSGRVQLYGVQFEANAAEVTYLQFFNAAAAADVTVGTTAPVWTIMVPASDGICIPPFAPLHHFDKGLVIAASKTSRTGNTAPATAATAKLWYVAN